MSEQIPSAEELAKIPLSEDLSALERETGAAAGLQALRGHYVAQPAPGWDVHGLWHTFGATSRSGYATHALALHWMLEKELRIPIQLIPHRAQSIDVDRLPKDRFELLFEWTKNAVGHPEMLFASFPVDLAAEMDGTYPGDETHGRVVPYTAFEATRISDYTKALSCGPIFPEIWTVSEFARRSFVDSGVPAEKVRTVRPMLWGGPWEVPKVRRRSSDNFVFGMLGSWQKRKGMHDLIRAYWSSFKRSDRVILSIRTSPFGADGALTLREFVEKIIKKELAPIAREFGDDDYPNGGRLAKISLDAGTGLTDAQVIEWIDGLDGFANPSYGEGLGIPHVWAKCFGIPMASTAFGAVGEMLQEFGGDGDEMVPHRLARVDQEMARHNIMFDVTRSEWGVYDYLDLGAAMRRIYERGRIRSAAQQETYRKAFGVETVEGLRTALRGVLPAEWADKWLSTS